MWIVAGTGNANFYYALNIVTAFANIVFLSDSLGAIKKRQFLMKKSR